MSIKMFPAQSTNQSKTVYSIELTQFNQCLSQRSFQFESSEKQNIVRMQCEDTCTFFYDKLP